MATTARIVVATEQQPSAVNVPSSSSNNCNTNTNTNNNIISAPIKIPLSERFTTQTSTGSADSGVIVSSASQKQLCSVSQTTLQQLQQLPVRSSSGSLSLHGSQTKWQKKQPQQQQQCQLLLLSQDSGIEHVDVVGGGSSSSGSGSGSSGIENGVIVKSKDKSSPGDDGQLSSSSSIANAGRVGGRGRARAASALELSSVGNHHHLHHHGGGGGGGGNALRRIKYKSTHSTGTQGFDMEDRIDEVDICDEDRDHNHDDDDDDDDCDVDVDVDVDEEDDGVAVDDVDADDDTQSGIIINMDKSRTHDDQQSAEHSPPPSTHYHHRKEQQQHLPLDMAPLTVAAAAAKKRNIKDLATDGHIYFPLLKISEDPHIDSKLINRKDGLQDTMYYLDEFGSPKLREKFARKQKQRQAKQQKAILKREREEQRKKRNTTVASNLMAITTTTTKDQHQQQHCDTKSVITKNNQSQNGDNDDDDDDDDVNDAAAMMHQIRPRSHSQDIHFDTSTTCTTTTKTNTTRHAHHNANEVDNFIGRDRHNPDNDNDDDDDIETGAEPDLDDSLENVKTAKLARTQSCVSWTKVVQKFKHILGRDGSKITTVVATPGQGTDRVQEVSYTDTKVIGNGSFGVVFQAKLCDTGELVAIKKVLQDRRFKNRELQIMRKLEHCNIVKLLYFFYSSGEKRDEVFLNLVLEYIPETVYKVARQYAKTKQTIPINFIRLYMYQLFRSLAYIHSLGICHRDIKPQNLLLDPETAVLKLCDFGSAKQLLHGEPNVSYICSRYYRAPELIFGAINYTTKIDVWSAGCVLAELLLGQPIFPGDSGVDQLVEVIKVLGTPTREQIREMNPNYTEFKFPQIKSHPWQKVFRIRTPTEAINLVSQLLEYTPSARITPLKACAHPFFDELRMEGNHTLPNGREMPPLFNFTEHELSIQPSLVPQLLPKHLQNSAATRSSAGGPATAGSAASGSTSVSSTGSGASADGGAAQQQPQQQQQAQASAGGAATATAAGGGSAASATSVSGGGGGGNNSNAATGAPTTTGPAAPTASSAGAGAAATAAAAAVGSGGGGGAAVAASAIATTNAGGATVTGSQSNSALNSSGSGSGNGNGNGNGNASDGGGGGSNGGSNSGGNGGDNDAAAADAETAASGSGAKAAAAETETEGQNVDFILH
ncbi:uncharacterized protein LOC6648991 isoform X2 [Drosophila willistoni]|uniref:uncharacterized protein LOC6648991 isoform X2 n=1 Tax=Drosophila willistoni TaxID=7260 RepID=UPI00017D8C85|nr:uncharacterized protein LOC6648991 isoform X2 [Drosophila willistoni]